MGTLWIWMGTKKYGWEPKNLPKERLFKGKYNIDHALTCEIGGFITRNDVVDVTVNFLSRVCRDFSKEPIMISGLILVVMDFDRKCNEHLLTVGYGVTEEKKT